MGNSTTSFNESICAKCYTGLIESNFNTSVGLII